MKKHVYIDEFDLADCENKCRRPANPKERDDGLGEDRVFTKEVHKMANIETDVDPKLLEILVCPLTKKPLRYDKEAQELISEDAKLAYPIRDGIPIMLEFEAREL